MIFPDGRNWTQGFTVLPFRIFPMTSIHLDIVSHTRYAQSQNHGLFKHSKWNGHPDVWIVETWIDHGFDSAQK